MKDYLVELVRGASTPLQARNRAREYLQARILGFLQRAGATLTTTVVRRHVILQLQHHDRASLFAGKLHAIFQRPYTKGRDLYDLLWYLSDPAWLAPNLALLNNALHQTGWSGPDLNGQNWRGILRDRLSGLEWPRVADDVRPLLEPGAAPEVLTLENIENALASEPPEPAIGNPHPPIRNRQSAIPQPSRNKKGALSRPLD